MNALRNTQHRLDESSLDYCIPLWEDDEPEEACDLVRLFNLNAPSHVRAFDDVA